MCSLPPPSGAGLFAFAEGEAATWLVIGVGLALLLAYAAYEVRKELGEERLGDPGPEGTEDSDALKEPGRPASRRR